MNYKCTDCGDTLTDDNWLGSSQKKNWYLCTPCKRTRGRKHYKSNSKPYKERAKENFGYRHNEWNRYSQLRDRTPKWANRDYMRLWYLFAEVESNRIGDEVTVDHIIPINGKNVCGLHCEDNMQLLTKKANSEKGVSYDDSPGA